jgi:hypothetical protein
MSVSVELQDEELINKFHEQHQDRAAMANRMLLYQSAFRYCNLIKDNIPNGQDFNAYAKAIDIFRVTDDAYGVRLKQTKSNTQAINPKSSIIYVRPNKKNRKGSKRDIVKILEILVKHGPWLLETIPYMPAKNEASLFTKTVNKNAVKAILTKNTKDSEVVARMLRRLGVQKSTKPSKDEKPTEVTSDMSQFGFGVEFGMYGHKSESHWRPALRTLLTVEMDKLQQDPKIQATLSNPRFMGWNNWQPPGMDTVGTNELEGAKDFMNRLAGAARI